MWRMIGSRTIISSTPALRYSYAICIFPALSFDGLLPDHLSRPGGNHDLCHAVLFPTIALQ
jgi:hypothetical protein